MFRVLVVLLALGSRAWAGLDCDDRAALADLEAYAKDRAAQQAFDDHYSALCIQSANPKLAARVAKACTKLLDRDGERGNPCVTIAAVYGLAKLGDHDIFALVSAFKEDPVVAAGGVGYYKVQLLEKLGDPRGAQVIRTMWADAQPRADAREKRHREMASWSGWRQYAAHALGVLGSADDARFLDAEAAATKDRYVAKACRDAAAAIRN